MRPGLALITALAAVAVLGGDVLAQGAAKDAAAKDKQPASTMVRLCPKQQPGGDKVNVRCAPGEKCCYHPLFDNGSCVPQAEACLGVVNPLPAVPR